MDRLDRQLEQLLGSYRQALDDVEPSVNFMPRLWQKIEARRNLVFRLRRFTSVFVGAAAAICLLIAGVSTIAPAIPAVPLHGTYLDALAEAHPSDTLAAQGLVREGDEGFR